MSGGARGSSGPAVRAGRLVKQINKHLLTGTYREKISSPAIIGLMNNSELSIRAGNFRLCRALHSQGGGSMKALIAKIIWRPRSYAYVPNCGHQGRVEKHGKICLFARWPVGREAKEPTGDFWLSWKVGGQGRPPALTRLSPFLVKEALAFVSLPCWWNPEEQIGQSLQRAPRSLGLLLPPFLLSAYL